MHKTSCKDSDGHSSRLPQDSLVTPGSGNTSFLTARSGTTSTAYNSVDSQPHYLEHMVNRQQDDNSDDEIDYSLLNLGMDLGQSSTSTPIPSSTTSSPPKDSSSDAESIKTVRPNNKGKMPLKQQPSNPQTALLPAENASPPNLSQKKKRKIKRVYRSNSNNKKPLAWKKSGFVFVSSLPTIVTPEPASIPTGKPIRREPILCMRSATGCLSNEPTHYKAAKEARYDLLTEKWRQMELVLTSSYLSTYSSSVSIPFHLFVYKDAQTCQIHVY